MGYTDTILDVRSSRIRSILGLSVADGAVPDHPQSNAVTAKGHVDDHSIIVEQVRPPKRSDQLPNRKPSEEELGDAVSPGRR